MKTKLHMSQNSSKFIALLSRRWTAPSNSICFSSSVFFVLQNFALFFCLSIFPCVGRYCFQSFLLLFSFVVQQHYISLVFISNVEIHVFLMVLISVIKVAEASSGAMPLIESFEFCLKLRHAALHPPYSWTLKNFHQWC